MSTDIDVRSLVTTEYLDLADLADSLDDAAWDTLSLCDGWRVREVIAHMTMPARYTTEQFMAELAAHEFDFTRLSNAIASRDAELPTTRLVADLRADVLHEWTPPGGDTSAALNHAVIHKLDVTIALGVAGRVPGDTLRVVLDDLTAGGIARHFGTDLTGHELRTTDLDWSYGSGTPMVRQAEELAVELCGRTLPG